jgi:hypothetical protein
MKFLLSPRFLAALIGVLLLLSLIPTSEGPVLEVILLKAGLSSVNSAAAAQLNVQREQAFKGFLVLSALKVGLAVLRSSQVGLILNIRIGDLAVAAYDYVNFGWKVLLAAVAYFYIAEFFLRFIALVDIWFLQAALASIGMVLALGLWLPGRTRLRAGLRRIGTVSGVLAIVLYLLLPLSFVAAGWVSSHITGGSINEAGRMLEATQRGMPGLGGDLGVSQNGESSAPIRTPSVTVPFPYDGSDPSQVLVEDHGEKGEPGQMDSAPVSRGQLNHLKSYLEERSKTLASAVLRQTSAYLFNVILVPLLSLLVLYWGSKFMISLFTPTQNLPQAGNKK